MPGKLFAKTVASAALMLALVSCAAPEDTTWIRITSIDDGESEASLSVVDIDLRDGTADTVDVTVENVSLIVGTSGGNGVAITVYSARVEYDHPAFDLPSFEYGVTLLLPAPGTTEAGVASETGTITGLPLVPVSLKEWILSPDNVPAEISAATFNAVANITLRARTEEGRELEVSGQLTLVFS